MTTQATFIAMTKARLNEWSAELALLKAQALTATVSARGQLESAFEEVKAHEEKLVTQLKEVETAGDSKWEELKAGFETGLTEMHTRFERVKLAMKGEN
jgi:hypothetical protein